MPRPSIPGISGRTGVAPVASTSWSNASVVSTSSTSERAVTVCASRSSATTSCSVRTSIPARRCSSGVRATSSSASCTTSPTRYGIPHAEYDVNRPRSKHRISSSSTGRRRRACAAAVMPPASPPTTTRRVLNCRGRAAWTVGPGGGAARGADQSRRRGAARRGRGPLRLRRRSGAPAPPPARARGSHRRPGLPGSTRVAGSTPCAPSPSGRCRNPPVVATTSCSGNGFSSSGCSS